FKTLHLLQFIESEAYRRMIGVQLNIGEGRHALGRRIFFGRLGELRHGYRDGMEDQLGALGMAMNSVVWWNTLDIDAAVKELEAGGLTISPEIRSRLSLLVHEHSNFHGRYPIVRSHATGPCGRCGTRTPPRNNPRQQPATAPTHGGGRRRGRPRTP
ncbi:Tn3 family transposase, partial [Streptomyces sp. NPDC057539]|uniref:Tn3 family transposase n=1 Tax=Streptomyces sp. NPDC057539 TaxID=3346159 RepID=UPI0036AE102E